MRLVSPYQAIPQTEGQPLDGGKELPGWMWRLDLLKCYCRLSYLLFAIRNKIFFDKNMKKYLFFLYAEIEELTMSNLLELNFTHKQT